VPYSIKLANSIDVSKSISTVVKIIN